MTLVILSEDYRRRAKSALHAALPYIRSSHLAETIATGAGERTHAALLARLAGAAVRHPPLVRLDVASMIARLLSLGYPPIPAASITDALEFAATPDRICVSYDRRDRRPADDHYAVCLRTSRPMLMIRNSRSGAELEWDCITIDPSEDGHVRGSRGDQLVETMLRLFQARCRGSGGRALVDGSAFTGTIRRLPFETARLIADDYMVLLYDPLSRQPATDLPSDFTRLDHVTGRDDPIADRRR